MTADDLITTFLTAQAAFTERVHAIAADQWQLGTPDAQWTVADLVGLSPAPGTGPRPPLLRHSAPTVR